MDGIRSAERFAVVCSSAEERSTRRIAPRLTSTLESRYRPRSPSARAERRQMGNLLAVETAPPTYWFPVECHPRSHAAKVISMSASEVRKDPRIPRIGLRRSGVELGSTAHLQPVHIRDRHPPSVRDRQQQLRRRLRPACRSPNDTRPCRPASSRSLSIAA